MSCDTTLVEFHHHLASTLDKGRQVFFEIFEMYLTCSLMHLCYINYMLVLYLKTLRTGSQTAYLVSQKQAAIVNGKLYYILNATSGVPQGSVLGPLLLLIFINKIADSIYSCMCLQDDD